MSGVNVIRRFSEDDELRFLAQRREKARRDEISAISNAEDRGLKKGIKQGIEKERAEMIDSMKQSGMTEEQINKVLLFRKLGN